MNNKHFNEKSSSQQNIILWGVKTSPYVRKVMVALAEKGIAYEQREIFPKVVLDILGQTIPDDFSRASPLGKIPALQINDFCIADSAVITAYLDREYPTTGISLYPKEPQTYAQALWFERYADATLTEVVYKKIFIEGIIKPKILGQKSNLEIIEYAKMKELPPLLDYLNQTITSQSWFAGEQFSMADVAIVVQLLALQTAGIYLTERWQALKNYLAKVIVRPSFQHVIS